MTTLDEYINRPGSFGDRWLASPVLMAFLLSSTLIGALFWVQAALQAEAFNVDTFGRFALRFPAEAWACSMMLGSLLAFAGLAHPTRQWLVLAGAVINAAQFSGLGYSAIWTGGEIVVGLYASLMFAPASLITLWAALQHDPD